MLTRGQRCVVALGTVFLLLIWGVGSESGGEERHAKGHFLQDLEAPLVESLDVGSGTEVPHDMDCSKNNEIFPGRVGRSNASRFRWLPEKCNLHAFSSREVEQCLKHVKVTILGDSLMRELSVNTLGLLHGVPKNLTMKAKEFDAHHSPRYYQGFEFFWAPALNEEPPHKQAMFRDHPLTRASVASADYVVLNSGMWDMGIYHCGVEAFYKKVGDWIGKVKGWMKPGAKFVVVPPHWLNTDATPKCAKTSPCFLCNHHKKVPVFREALSLAAACHNVPVLDMVHVPRTTPHDSRDGIHYDSNVRYMFADILLAYICRGMQPMPLTRCSYVTTHLAAWNAIPEAHVPCQTAPGEPPVKLHAKCNQH